MTGRLRSLIRALRPNGETTRSAAEEAPCPTREPPPSAPQEAAAQTPQDYWSRRQVAIPDAGFLVSTRRLIITISAIGSARAISRLQVDEYPRLLPRLAAACKDALIPATTRRPWWISAISIP